MYSIETPIRALIRKREQKIREMEAAFDPDTKIARYKQESLEVIRTTYVEIARKIRSELEKDQSKIKEKYHSVVTPDEISREVIRAGAYTNRQLQQTARTIRESNIPVRSEIALVYARELRQRGGKDNVDLADNLAMHVETFLDCPWIADPSYKSLEKLRQTTLTMEAYSTDFLVLSLQPTQKEVVSIQGDDFYERGAAPQSEKFAVIDKIKAEAMNVVQTS